MIRRSVLPALLGIVALAALAPSAYAETIQGKNFDDTLLGVDENGNYIHQWQAKPERIEVQPNQYVNYLLKDTDNYFRFESENAAVQFNKSTCTLRLYDAGEVISGENPIVDSISMTLKEAENGTDDWTAVSLNQQGCELSYVPYENGIQMTARKSSQVIGFGPVFDTVYNIDYSGMVKTTFKYMNGDLTKSNHKYGFTQNFNGAFSVRIGTQEYDLSSLNSEIMFTKNDLNGKTIIIKKNGFSIEYDPQNYIHDYLWAVKLNPNSVALDFTNSPGKLNIGDTLEIDPTFGYTAGTKYVVGGSASGGATCATASYSDVVELYTIMKPDTGDAVTRCQITGVQWDISSIPSGSTITNSSLQIKITLATNQQNINITEITHNLAAANAETKYNDIMNTANGSSYVTNSACCTSAGTKNVDLGTTADADIQSGLSSGRFAVGFVDASMVRDGSTRYFRTDAGGAIELSVTYTLPPPGPPSGLSCTSQARQMSCTWNPSTPSSGTQNSIITYYMGRSLDNSTYTNKTSTGNVTSTLSYAYWKINQLYHINMTSNNGLNSTTSAHATVTTDNFPSAPVSLYTTSLSDTSVKVNYGTPASNGNDPITGYRVEYCVTCTSWTTAVNKTNTLNYNITGLPGGSTPTIRVAAWNGVALGTFSANITGSTFQSTVATTTLDVEVVGDTAQINATVSVTVGSPNPTITQSKLYSNGTLLETHAESSTVTPPQSVTLSPFWYRLPSTDVYSLKVVVTVTNSSGTKTFNATSNETREYNPSYLAALEDPSVQGDVNATVARFDGQDGVLLKVNRLNVAAGDTWQIECIAQTNTQAAATRNETERWSGTWRNRTSTGYFNTTWDGYRNTHVYITCFNEDKLFTFTSFTNSSLALLGIGIFDDSYGAMLGVPVGIFFLALAGGMANKRTAPTWIVVLCAMAGVMATVGFFSLEPIVWGLALVTALCGLLVNQKVF